MTPPGYSRQPETAGFDKRLDLIVHQREPFNAEPPRTALAEHPITPLDAFYVRGHGPVVQKDPPSWRLQIAGLIDSELTLDLADLQGDGFRKHEVVATLQCAGNRRRGLIEARDIPGEAPWGPGATGTARWRGVRLADALDRAGIAPQARHAAFIGADPSEEADPPQTYGASIPLTKALQDEVLLAWAMNDQPLPAVHGGPVRVIVPGYIGARSVKWVERIELRADPWDGYFQATSYRLLAPDQAEGPGAGMALQEIGLNADFLSPEDGAELSKGTVKLTGYAIAGGERQIARVDVSVDGGPWVQPQLREDQGRWAWRLWAIELSLPRGTHEVIARAWDTAANTQPEFPETVWNPKGYVNNSWARLTLHLT